MKILYIHKSNFQIYSASHFGTTVRVSVSAAPTSVAVTHESWVGLTNLYKRKKKKSVLVFIVKVYYWNFDYYIVS